MFSQFSCLYTRRSMHYLSTTVIQSAGLGLLRAPVSAQGRSTLVIFVSLFLFSSTYKHSTTSWLGVYRASTSALSILGWSERLLVLVHSPALSFRAVQTCVSLHICSFVCFEGPCVYFGWGRVPWSLSGIQFRHFGGVRHHSLSILSLFGIWVVFFIPDVSFYRIFYCPPCTTMSS